MLTASSSLVGAVTLTSDTVGSSFVWSKDGHAFATTATGSVVDRYPVFDFVYYEPLHASIAYTGTFTNYTNAAHLNVSKAYRKSIVVGDKITITTNALNIGFYFDTFRGPLMLAQDNLVQFTVDGVVTWEAYFYTRYQAVDFNKICWGTELDGATHTIEIILLKGSMVFGGYKASHFKAHYNDVINYSVLIDGTTTETVAHFARLDYSDTLKDYGAKVLAIDVATAVTITCLTAISRLAGIYNVVPDPAYRTKALEFLNKINTSYIDADGCLIAPAAQIVWNGRIPLYCMPAYKAFGDVGFLTLCDSFTSMFRNTWATLSADITLVAPQSAGTVHLDRVWGQGIRDTNVHNFVNLSSAAAASALTCYLEPNSIHYHDAVLLDMVHRNMVAGMLNYCPSVGRLTTGYANDLGFETMYGAWEFTHIDLYKRSVPDRVIHSGLLLSTIHTNVATWLSSYGDKWPFVWESQEYVHPNEPGYLSYIFAARNAIGAYTSRWMLDLMFASETFSGGCGEFLNLSPVPLSAFIKTPLWNVDGVEVNLYDVSGNAISLHDTNGKLLNYSGI